MLLSRTLNAYQKLKREGWREILVRLNEMLRANYFDFSPQKTHELGLDPNRSNAYRGSATDVCYVLNLVPLLPDSSIIDVGSGKGRAMITMARFPFKKIAGVEISPELAEVSRRNLSRALLGRRSEVHTSCASVFAAYDSFNYLYFYNPFPVPVFKDAMAHIRASLVKSPRECWLIYNAATDDGPEKVILTDGVFERVLEYQPPGRKLIVAYRHRPGNYPSNGNSADVRVKDPGV